MVIDFNDIELQKLPNFKGGEKAYDVKMFTDSDNKIMKGTLVPGASIGFHKHENDCEVIFITGGTGVLDDDGCRIPVAAGQCLYCPRGHSHSLTNDSDTANLEFYAVVSAFNV